MRHKLAYVIMGKIILFIIITCCMTLISCDNYDSVRDPEFHSAIQMNEDLDILDWGHCGEPTADGKYYYVGTVTLYSSEGTSETFDCFEGTEGMEKGCKGVLWYGTFHNIYRNKWVTIDGVKYKGGHI